MRKYILKVLDVVRWAAIPVYCSGVLLGIFGHMIAHMMRADNWDAIYLQLRFVPVSMFLMFGSIIVFLITHYAICDIEFADRMREIEEKGW